MRVQAWAPGHATLLFASPASSDEPLQKGSTGAGLNFEAGVLTTAEKSEKNEIFWNSKPINGIVTQTVIDQLKQRFNIQSNFKINHYSELKIGHGLSTSGAGAIGTALAINHLLTLDKPTLELQQIAHYADVINHTGLGSVMGQLASGIEFRTVAGGPGVGQTKSIASNEQIIILMMGKLKTSDVLVSADHMEQVNKAGATALRKALAADQIDLDMLLEIGRNFTKECGLMTTRVERVMSELDDLGEQHASMAMIGETIVIRPIDAKRIIDYANRHRINAVVTKITTKEPQIVNNFDSI